MHLNLSDPIVEELVTVRVSLLFNFPFFGSVVTRLNIVDASRWCNTITTDGRNIYYNRDWIKSLSRPKLHFAMVHTVLHAVYDHLGRRGNRDKQLWDMATDYIVNYTLVKENIGEKLDGILYNEKFTDEMSVEEVYKILEENSTKVQIPFDQHMDLGADQRDENGQTVSVTVMGDDGNGPPQLSEADLEQIRNQVKANLINAAQQAAGKLPAGIARLIEDLTEPKMDWRQLLTATIQSLVKDDFTFTRFSKKTWSMGGTIIIPAQHYLNTIKILLAIDTSGSITDDILRTFLAEVKGIIEIFPEFTLHVLTWDTRVYGHTEFNPSNIDDLLTGQYSFDGGGGTSPACIWEFLAENDLDIERMVILTDGYFNENELQDTIDTLYVVHSNPSWVAPYGVTAHFEDVE